MTGASYSIFFDGVTLAGVPLETVKTNLAALLQRDLAEIDALFSGETVALKQGLFAEETDRHLRDFHQAGIIARKASETPEAPAASVQPPPDTATPNKQYGEVKFISFQGRLGRVRFLGRLLGATLVTGLIFAIFIYLFSLTTNLLRLQLNMTMVFRFAFRAEIVFGLAWIVVYATFAVRRLHDINLPGWWAVIPLTSGVLSTVGDLMSLPFFQDGATLTTPTPAILFLASISWIANIFLCLKPGSAGSNNYGAPPPPNSDRVKVMAGIAVFCAAAMLLGWCILRYRGL
jgi:uncharacterized membrane protein YhaH (DUF805 family)